MGSLCLNILMNSHDLLMCLYGILMSGILKHLFVLSDILDKNGIVKYFV